MFCEDPHEVSAILPRVPEGVLARGSFLLDAMTYVFLCLLSKLVRSQEVTVVAYHSVGVNNSFYTVRPGEFRRQMDFLRRNYKIVPLASIVEFAEGRTSLPRKSVALTFDDGYYDNFLNVYPYLKEFNLPAAIFICTAHVGGTMCLDGVPLRMLDWSEIVEMSRNNVAIAAHTVTHPDLSVATIEQAKTEIVNSRKEIQARVSKSIDYFAFPSSRFRRDIGELVQSLGFRAAFLCGLDGTVQRGDNTFALHRLSIDSSMPFVLFKACLTKGARWRSKLLSAVPRSDVHETFLRIVAR